MWIKIMYSNEKLKKILSTNMTFKKIQSIKILFLYVARYPLIDLFCYADLVSFVWPTALQNETKI